MRQWAVLLVMTMVTTALVAFSLLTANPAHAATTFTVNSTEDYNDLDFPAGVFDGSSDGKCDVDAGTPENQCTLRLVMCNCSDQKVRKVT